MLDTPTPAPGLRTMELTEFARRLAAPEPADMKFAFFLGAGCSAASGIPTAGELVKHRWLPRLHALQAPTGQDLDAWAREYFPDYDPAHPATLYGRLIDALFVTPHERQREIETLCENKSPSFGYAVLAALVAGASGRFNVVLTTNFDDLVADALYLYTDQRPLVIQHESLAAFIRPTRTRPLVVKLHGDHRLAPRNTALETAALAEEIARHTALALHDRGLIFIGYGGADDSIHKLLQQLPAEALPFGAYWVHAEEPTGPIAEWLRQRGGVWVKARRFEHVMIVLREAFNLPHPTRERFDRIFYAYMEQFAKLSAEVEGPGSTAPAEVRKALGAAEASLDEAWQALIEGRRLERENPGRADAHYRAAVEKFPTLAPLLGNYANFLTYVRKDYAAAEGFYKRALEGDPNHANILGNYAVFLENVRQDYEAAEGFYKCALQADPNHANNLGNYALFLKNVRKDHDGAERLYKRALEGDPNYANSLGNYAVFLENVRKDHDGAERLYKRAVEANPNHANNLGNYGGFLLGRGRAEGLPLVERALEYTGPGREASLAECEFYILAHGPAERRAPALRRLRELLEAGARSPGWDLSNNVAVAEQAGHPDARWLARLAAVISGNADAATLADWPAWRAAGEAA